MYSGYYRLFYFLALLLLLPGVKTPKASEPRHPFDLPKERKINYDYNHAIRLVKLKGIIRTEKYSGCLIQVGDANTITVLKPGERISLDQEEAPHLFTVSEIREKSVVFISGANQTYEVPIQ